MISENAFFRVKNCKELQPAVIFHHIIDKAYVSSLFLKLEKNANLKVFLCYFLLIRNIIIEILSQNVDIGTRAMKIEGMSIRFNLSGSG